MERRELVPSTLVEGIRTCIPTAVYTRIKEYIRYL